MNPLKVKNNEERKEIRIESAKKALETANGERRIKALRHMLHQHGVPGYEPVTEEVQKVKAPEGSLFMQLRNEVAKGPSNHLAARVILNKLNKANTPDGKVYQELFGDKHAKWSSTLSEHKMTERFNTIIAGMKNKLPADFK